MKVENLVGEVVSVLWPLCMGQGWIAVGGLSHLTLCLSTYTTGT
jgi:hypothetical protein